MENEEEENQDDIPEGNNDDRFTKVENDVYLIEGYDEGKQEENKEPEVADTPLNNKDKPKKALEKTTILVAAIPRLNRINFINFFNVILHIPLGIFYDISMIL